MHSNLNVRSYGIVCIKSSRFLCSKAGNVICGYNKVQLASHDLSAIWQKKG